MFPLSNWSEFDVWLYIHVENIPIVPLYFAKEREVVVRGDSVLLMQSIVHLLPGEEPTTLSAACVRWDAFRARVRFDPTPTPFPDYRRDDYFRRSERENRAIDHDEEGSMELKKREGYF